MTKLLYYWLKSPYFQEQVFALAPSTTLPILSKGKWEQIPLPLPPLKEQKRIIARVDELMKLCDALEAKLTQARSLSESMAASLINHVFSEAEENTTASAALPA
jgi:type I restriction enzyme S subunit